MDTTYLLQLLLNGLVIGVIYALIAMGLSLIFGLLGIVNFAHGEFYMLGAMLSFFAVTDLHCGYWTTILAVTLVAGAVGLLLYHLFLASLRPADFERSILLTLGISMVLQNGGIFLFDSDATHCADAVFDTPLSPSAICSFRCCGCSRWASGDGCISWRCMCS